MVERVENIIGLNDEHTITDLQSLLRTRMGDGVEVIEYGATNFLPPGENYGSLILKVDAVIRRDGEKSPREELRMIAKVPPLTQQQRDLFDSPFTFKKEIFMYDTILPTYADFERECGIDENDVFDVGPKFYGSRLNLRFGDVFDDNAIILMENLKARGYYSGDRYKGLDIDHSRLAVKSIARFHALGMAIKSKKPDFFEILKIRSKCLELSDPSEWEDSTRAMYRTIKEHPFLGKYYDVCIKALKAGEVEGSWTAVPEEPWSTIIHDDFWINNILFHRNEDNQQVDDIKFVDFQNYMFYSPLRELSFLLGVVVDHDVSERNIPELIDLYHETLVSRLEIMGCDATPYARPGFDERLSKDAFLEFSHSVFMLKITTTKVDADDPESKNLRSVISKKESEEYFARMTDLFTVYANQGWFSMG